MTQLKTWTKRANTALRLRTWLIQNHVKPELKRVSESENICTLNCSSICRQKFWEYAACLARTGFQILSLFRDSDCATPLIMTSITLSITLSITPRSRRRARMQSGTSHSCKRASITPQSCLRRDFNLVSEMATVLCPYSSAVTLQSDCLSNHDSAQSDSQRLTSSCHHISH